MYDMLRERLDKIKREFDFEKAPVISQEQYEAAVSALKRSRTDPEYFSSIFGGGPVREFEEAFAEAVGSKYALALCSCTASIHASLLACNIGPGDEVVTTPYTWGQSIAPILYIGATPVFADIDPRTATIDPQAVKSAITERTKAILPVHLFGIPADMDALCGIAKEHGLVVIADAAQAFGALSKGRKIGSVGDAACFSLGPNKVVTGGEGGVLATNNREIYERAVGFTQHPMRAFRDCSDFEASPASMELSLNYRIHPVAAVMALADLKNAEERVALKKCFRQKVYAAIRDISCLRPLVCYSGDEDSGYGVPFMYIPEANDGVPTELLDETLAAVGAEIFRQPSKNGLPVRVKRLCEYCRSSTTLR